MNYGLYLSASGVMTNMHRLDLVANNLANANTVGFKPDFAQFIERLPARLEGADPTADPQRLLEQLGGNLFVSRTETDFSQGALTATGRPLDLAIEGDGFFIVADGPADAPENLRFTRDGRFTLNDDGLLVMSATGLPAIDVTGQPVRLDPSADLRITSEGVVMQNDQPVAQLLIAAPADPEDLVKVGDNLLRLPPDLATPPVPASGRVRQGHTEASAADPIMMLNRLVTASKAVSGNAQMMQYADTLMNQAINTFGRVS